ncbi:MAG: putative zinc-binding metallopeptidase [Patescibacteria group bacterium]
MRLKILSLFAAIQILSFGIWTNLSHAEPSVPQSVEQAQVHPAPALPSALAEDTEESALLLHFATRNMGEEKRFLNDIKKNQIETVLKKLPEGHAQSVENIILDYSPEAHRGLGGNSMIILRGVNMSTEETIAVLVHELGHNVDYAYLAPSENISQSPFRDGNAPIYESDPSLDFYRISWEDVNNRKKTADNLDFVSGYAMSDPFEDFAETYAYYVLHNKDFKKLASSSDALYAKYRFMKYEVFDGTEFDTGDGDVEENARPWDVTVLSYEVSDFLS